MAWRRSGDKPLSEPVVINFLRHICVTRPQWVNKDNGWLGRMHASSHKSRSVWKWRFEHTISKNIYWITYNIVKHFSTKATLPFYMDHCWGNVIWAVIRDHSWRGLGPWEKALHGNASSHWLSPYAEGSLVMYYAQYIFKAIYMHYISKIKT